MSLNSDDIDKYKGKNYNKHTTRVLMGKDTEIKELSTDNRELRNKVKELKEYKALTKELVKETIRENLTLKKQIEELSLINNDFTIQLQSLQIALDKLKSK